jgi:hypothetical protein
VSVGDLTNSIISGLNDGLEQWLEGTIVAILPILWAAIVGLFVARPYVLTIIERFTLRLGSDILWIVYVIVRDLLVISGVVGSFMFLFPDVVTGNDLPLFGGLAAAALFGVLLVMLVGDPDHNPRDHRIVMNLVGIGAILYYVSYFFGVQFNDVATGTLKRISDALVTSSNPNWGLGVAYVSMGLLAIMGAVAVWQALKDGGSPDVEEPLVGDQGGVQP